MIHGRAHLYGADGQLRIWEVGTHHEYQPNQASWSAVEGWLNEGPKSAGKSGNPSPASAVYLFGDFLICPTELYKKGAVQTALIKDVKRRRYVPAD